MSPSAANTGSSGAPAPRGDLRVVLVGRTPLDSALRRDPRIELSRCRTALEAVGELADPIDDSSPSAAAVIVSAAADPAEARERFVAALRMIDPHAPVLLERESASGVVPVPPYDGVVVPSATAHEVRDVIARVGLARTGWVSGKPVEAPAVSQPQPSAPTPAGPAPGVGVGVPPPINVASDYRVVQALLSGRDPLLPALDLIRARTATADIGFIPAVSPAGTQHAEPEDGIAVLVRARPVGWLRGPAGLRAVLQAHAEWLGAWLALLEQQALLRHAAMVDDLTGAYNRRYFDQYLAAAIDQAQRQRQSITLMVFDIDDFKSFNDRYGHPAGDDILRETVRLLRSVIRPADRVCRIGGDEFAVVFYDASGPRDPGSKPPEDVSAIARRFQRQIREHRFPKLGDAAPGSLTISGGIATYPWDGRTVAELVERADQLALAAKRAGKNAIAMGPGAESA